MPRKKRQNGVAVSKADIVPETKLADCVGFTEEYIIPLSNIGVNTIGDMHEAGPDVLAAVVVKESEVDGNGHEISPKRELGAATAASLLERFPLKGTITKDQMRERYIYRTRSARTIDLRRENITWANDGAGGVRKVVTQPSLHIQFTGTRSKPAYFYLTPEIAKEMDMSIPDIRELIEKHMQFKNGEITLVNAPAEQGKGITLIRGTRGRS